METASGRGIGKMMKPRWKHFAMAECTGDMAIIDEYGNIEIVD